MSLAAHRFVRQLKAAPRSCCCPGRIHGSERITIQERAFLWFLADHHNEKVGAAWPAIPTIARYHGIRDRRAQQIIAALACRGILLVRARSRENGSKQSNAYSFPAIDGWRIANAAPQAECSSETSPARTTEVHGEGRADALGDTSTMPPPDDAGVTYDIGRRPGLHLLNQEGTERESAMEPISATLTGKVPPTPQPQKGGYVVQVPETLLTKFGAEKLWSVVKLHLKEQLASTSVATDLPYEYDKYFLDSWQRSVHGLELHIEATYPEALREGIQRYQRRMAAIFKQVIGLEPTLVVVQRSV